MFPAAGRMDSLCQAPAPARLIEGALPPERAIAHVLVSKYSEHQPLYRQALLLGAQVRRRSGP